MTTVVSDLTLPRCHHVRSPRDCVTLAQCTVAHTILAPPSLRLSSQSATHLTFSPRLQASHVVRVIHIACSVVRVMLPTVFAARADPRFRCDDAHRFLFAPFGSVLHISLAWASANTLSLSRLLLWCGTAETTRSVLLATLHRQRKQTSIVSAVLLLSD